jgi:hypothetical protein
VQESVDEQLPGTAVSARYLETEALPPPADDLENAGRILTDADGYAPAPASAWFLATGILLMLSPIPFIFSHEALWSAERLLPVLFAVGWTALAANAAALAVCFLSKSLCTPVGVLTCRLANVYGGIAWLSGLILTYLLWGVGAVIAGIVCLGGGVVTTGLVSALVRGHWQFFFPLLLFVVLAFAARRAGITLARHGTKFRL